MLWFSAILYNFKFLKFANSKSLEGWGRENIGLHLHKYLDACQIGRAHV